MGSNHLVLHECQSQSNFSNGQNKILLSLLLLLQKLKKPSNRAKGNVQGIIWKINATNFWCVIHELSDFVTSIMLRDQSGMHVNVNLISFVKW